VTVSLEMICGIGGDAEAVPPSFPDAIEKGQGTTRISFRAPGQPGGYRVFVTAYDGQGGAVAHNVPFYVGDQDMTEMPKRRLDQRRCRWQNGLGPPAALVNNCVDSKPMESNP